MSATCGSMVAADASNLGSVDPKLAAMSFSELDSAITERVASVKTKLSDLVPYLREMRELLSHQGKRTDLRGVPKGLTWQKWVEEKKDLLGSLSTVKRLLRGDSKKRKKEPSDLSHLEYELLGTAAAGYDLVKAIQQPGANVDAAVQDFVEFAVPLDRIEKLSERPMKPLPAICKLAANLVRDVEAYFSTVGVGGPPENLRLALADLKSELSLTLLHERQQRPKRRYKADPDSCKLGLGSKGAAPGPDSTAAENPQPSRTAGCVPAQS